MAFQRSPGMMVFSLVLPYLTAIQEVRGTPIVAAHADGWIPLSHLDENITLAIDLPSTGASTTIPFPSQNLLARLTHYTLHIPYLSSSRSSSTSSIHPPTRSLTLGTLSARHVSVVVPTGYTELRQTFNAGYIVLSYVVAVVGSLCTLELLLRRTSNRGTHNVLLLVAAGICFGAVSTFSMHFIGNNSLTLHHPLEAERHYAGLSLSYSAGYTILSLVVSCSAMTAAFFVMGLEVDWRGVVKKTGVGRWRHHHYEDGTDTEDEEEEDRAKAQGRKGADLSQEVKKKELKEVRSQMKRLERKTKLNDVMKKLEWALSWSMVTVPTEVAGDTRAERMTIELRRAEEKAKKLEDEIGGIGLDSVQRQEVVNGTRHLDVVETVASDPVASGYDNPVDQPRMVPVAQVAERDLEDLSVGQGIAMSASLGASAQSADGRKMDSSPTAPAYTSSNQAVTIPPVQPATPPSASDSLFSPGFSFPAHGSSVASPAKVDPFVPPHAPRMPVYPHRYPPPISAVPSHLSASAGRRASLPAALYGFPGPVGRDFARPSFSLARISSLPDQDQDDQTLANSSEPINEEEAEKEEQKIVDEVMASARIRSSEKSFSHAAGESRGVPPFSDTPRKSDYGENTFGLSSVSSSTALHSEAGQVDQEKAMAMRDDTHGRRVRRRRERRKAVAKRYARWESWLGLDVVTQGDILKVVVTGTIAGMGVAGMHYIGQRSITSYPYIAYSAGMVVASVVIACVSVTAGLYIMFIILRPKLKHGWAVKIGVACILGAAVCFMHYCGMGGTTYALHASQIVSSQHLNKTGNRAITGVVAALALLACIAILSFTILQQLRQLAHRRQRRKVVIATMIYDQDDRLLVSPDGMVPLIDVESVISSRQAIKNAMKRQPKAKGWDSESSTSSILDVDLTTSHPAFISAIRSTWAWRQPGVLPAVQLSDPRSGLSDSTTLDTTSQYSEPNTSASRRLSMLSTAESAIYPGSIGPLPLAQNVGKFLDRFSVAVSTLARDVIGSPEAIRRLGVLYDRILTTGHVSIGNQAGHAVKSRKDTVAKGQMLFLVRRVTTQHEQSQLLARNYLFAEQSAVANVMAKILAVPVGDFLDIMHDQTDFCDYGMTTNVKPGKLYGGLCVIQPTTSDGIRIVVERQRRHQLPLREVCSITSMPLALRSQCTERSVTSISATVEELGEAALALSGQTLFDMIAAHNEDSGLPGQSDDLSIRLRNALVEALIPMLDLTFPSKAMARVLPRLTITPTLIPLFVPLPATNPKHATHARVAPELAQSSHTAWIIMFKAILAVDTDCSNLDLEPWSLFRAQNECILRDGRESAAAMRVAALAAISANALAGQIPPEANRGRRPSKVQWMNLGPTPTTPTTPSGLNPLHEDPLDSAFFIIPLPTDATRNDKAMSPSHEKLPLAPSTMPYMLSPSDNTGRRASSTPAPIHMDAGRANRPRDLAIFIPKPAMRANAAPAAVESDGGEAFTVDMPAGGREITPGVSFYHPDWLTRILREDLLPRANEEDDDDEN